MDSKMQFLTSRLKDSRSKKVILISHCLLNENSRYLGGAFRAGAVDEVIIELLSNRIGIVQLPCPEQHAWGGILKPFLWMGVGIKAKPIYFFRKIIFYFFVKHSKRIFRKITRDIIKLIKDYQKANFEVIGFIGIGGSPTCGIHSTLDLKKYELLAEISLEQLKQKTFNDLLYSEFLNSGKGLFTMEFEKALARAHIQLPFYEHDLQSEMGKTIPSIFSRPFNH